MTEQNEVTDVMTDRIRSMNTQGYSNAEIAEHMGISENSVREALKARINWGYNCLTSGVHHGRPEPLWNMPLLHAALYVFSAEDLKDLVIARIYNDAMQFVEDAGVGDHVIATAEWANAVKARSEEIYRTQLQHKVGELTRYYTTTKGAQDHREVVRLVQENKLNSNYQPLHGHDSINMLCRIIGVSASLHASKGG